MGIRLSNVEYYGRHIPMFLGQGEDAGRRKTEVVHAAMSRQPILQHEIRAASRLDRTSLTFRTDAIATITLCAQRAWIS